MNPAPTYELNIHAVPMLLMGIVTLGLGCLVYRSDRHSSAHRHFFILCASSALWLTATSIGLCATTPDKALAWFKLDSVGVMFISIAFYAFSAEFLQLHRPRSIWLGYGLAVLLAGAALLHQDFVAGVHRYWWGYYLQYGSASAPFFVFFFTYMAVAFTDYLRAYRTASTPIKRQQIKFVFSAFIIAYLGSVDFLPAFGYEVYPFGYIPIFFLLVVVTTAILRYQLLDSSQLVSMSAPYLPLIPFTLAVFFVADRLREFSSTVLAGTLVGITVLFAILYVIVQPRLQSALNKLLFPGRHNAYNTLTHFTHTMVMNLDLASLQAEIIRTLQTVMGIEKISVFLFEKEQGRYLSKASHGIEAGRADTVQLPGDDPLTDLLLKRDRPLVKEEFQHGFVEQERRDSAVLMETLTKMEAEVCLPLVNKARLIGFVNLGHKPYLGFYSADELDLLGSLANNAAIALDNAMLYEEWKRSQLLIRRADRLRSLETIAGGFAHEVRNPLTSIKTFIQLAPSRRDDSEFMDHFGSVVADDLARIERLIEEILDYARYMKPKFSLDSINEIVESSLHFLQIKASNSGVSLEKHLADEIPPIMVDRQQIKQVLMNLALNAIDAMRGSGGRLTVTTRHLTRLDGTLWVQIQVSDSGCGIAPEDLPHIFDPFFTTKHESTEHVGTGLGLSIVHQIIQEHGGTVEVHSTVGQGTTFMLTFPEKTVLDSAPTPDSSPLKGTLVPLPTIQSLLQGRTGTYGP
ncbi:MAG: GAF domain-containing protein [Nitrospira sp.]|nr:GAF domain-containing protein [Nitrospira sp.]